jgi:CO/xanthine dehydrogenase Mo-binding subunit
MTATQLAPITGGLTREAADALERAGYTRRAFLRGSGALVVGIAMADLAGPVGESVFVAAAQAPPDRRAQLDSWIAVAADGSVTAYAGKCELGQGLFTAQTQLVAEELDVPLARVRLIYCDTAVTPRRPLPRARPSWGWRRGASGSRSTN